MSRVTVGLMGEDEVGTFHTLSDYLEIMNTIITVHRGNVFSSPGDAILAQFASVVDAVECAVEIQNKIETKNADVYVELGREEEAQTHAAEVLRIKPGFSLEEVSNITTFGYKDPAHLERRLNALRKAGIPETPPLALPDKPKG